MTARRNLDRMSAARRLGGLAAASVRRPIEVEPPAPLRTDRLALRPLRPGDRDAFIRAERLSRAHLARFSPLHRAGERDEDAFERHLALGRAGDRTGRAWRRIIDLGDGRIAGAVNLNDLRRGLECAAEINWWVSADCVGRGLATEAVETALEHALKSLPWGLGLDVVGALIAPENAPSLRIAEKVGLVRDRPARAVELNVGGRWAAHDAFVRFARVPRARVRGASKRLLRAGLASILQTERATLLHASAQADPAAAGPHAPAEPAAAAAV